MTSQSLTRQQNADARTSAATLSGALSIPRDPSLSLFTLRLTLALVLFPHGAQKLLGWFGGYGWSGTMGFLTESVGLPTALAAGVILLEFFGPLLLLVGVATRPVGLAMAGLMVGAVATVHAQHGFFMNWSGAQAGEGFEYHLLVIGLGLALALGGPGRWSLTGRRA